MASQNSSSTFCLTSISLPFAIGLDDRSNLKILTVTSLRMSTLNSVHFVSTHRRCLTCQSVDISTVTTASGQTAWLMPTSPVLSALNLSTNVHLHINNHEQLSMVLSLLVYNCFNIALIVNNQKRILLYLLR